MTTDLKSKSVEELRREVYITLQEGYHSDGVLKSVDELARRLEEAQKHNELYAAEMSEAKAAGFYSAQELWRAYQMAQQKIVAQQAMSVDQYEALNFYADPGTWFAVMLVPDHPAGQIMEDFSETELDQKPGDLARSICEKYKDQRLDELAAHDAKVAAVAKAEAMEEAVNKCFDLTLYTGFDCAIALEEKAAEYRAKAGRKECAPFIATMGHYAKAAAAR